MAGSISGRISGARETARQGYTLSSFTVASISISSSEKIRVVPGKVVIASFFHRAHLSRLHRGFWPDAVHQQPDRQHGVFFIDAGLDRLFFPVHHIGFDGGQLQPLAGNIDIFAFRNDLSPRRPTALYCWW